MTATETPVKVKRPTWDNRPEWVKRAEEKRLPAKEYGR